MELSSKAANLGDVLPWRDMYRLEMGCQIIHDSIHSRPGWTQEYCFFAGGTTVGYGSVAVGGPWKGKLTVYEFYVLPPHRLHVFELFRVLLTVSGAVMINVQSNDSFITVMLHTFGQDVTNESVLVHDKLTTALSPAGATFRGATPAEVSDIPDDIYIDVAESFRRRGLGSFLVQELKRVCYEGGNIPAARCNPGNVASRRTLQKAVRTHASSRLTPDSTTVRRFEPIPVD